MMKNKIVLVFNFALLGLLALYSFVHAQTAVPVPTPNATQSPLSPAGAVFVSGSSGVVANSVAAATLPAVVGKTNYVSEIQITNSGASAAACVTATLSGVVTTNLAYVICAPSGVSIAAQPFVLNFSPPLPASGTNTAITISVPALGSGNVAAAANIAGFNQ